MDKINSIFYMYSNLDGSSQILLFLIILVFLMLLSIFIINVITRKKSEKYDNSFSNITRYSNIIEKENNNNKLEEKNNIEVVEVVSEDNSIEEISKLIEENLIQDPIDLTKFEEEQEKDAIISYDELVKKAGAKKIIYKTKEKEEDIEILNENSINNEKTEYTKRFKASEIVSPVYGIQKKLNDKNENVESFVDLEKYDFETKNENDIQMQQDVEFLGSLKTFRNGLE